jgi:hypothetical protein
MTERLVDHPERVFQVWAYTVGMGRLLLRSTKSETFGTRVDVLFQDVEAMKLLTRLDGLVVTVAAAGAASEITEATGLLQDEETVFFALDTSTGAGYVVAGVVTEVEDEGEYFEPSKVWPGPEGLLR